MEKKQIKNLRQASKENYGVELAQNESVHIDNINTGSLQRIADATEKMAVGFIDLQNRAELLQRVINEKNEIIKRKQKEIILLKSANTRLKNTIKKSN